MHLQFYLGVLASHQNSWITLLTQVMKVYKISELINFAVVARVSASNPGHKE